MYEGEAGAQCHRPAGPAPEVAPAPVIDSALLRIHHQAVEEQVALRVAEHFHALELEHLVARRGLLLDAGLLEPPFHYGFVFNVPGSVPYSVADLEAFCRALPDGADFTVMGIGRSSLPAQLGALARGGWIRVGLEDNVYYSKGVLARSNAQLVDRAARLARLAGVEPASPEDVREHLQLRR